MKAGDMDRVPEARQMQLSARVEQTLPQIGLDSRFPIRDVELTFTAAMRRDRSLKRRVHLGKDLIGYQQTSEYTDLAGKLLVLIGIALRTRFVAC